LFFVELDDDYLETSKNFEAMVERTRKAKLLKLQKVQNNWQIMAAKLSAAV
jgi:hypothetical protein